MLITAVVAETSGTIVELEIMPDHVHLLISIDPQHGIHRMIKRIKEELLVPYGKSFRR